MLSLMDPPPPSPKVPQELGIRTYSSLMKALLPRELSLSVKLVFAIS